MARLVVDHGDAALGAFQHLAAVVALGHGLVAAAVEQQDGLPARVEVAPDGVLHRKADLPRVARGQLCPHIHDLDAGQRVAAVALGEPDQLGAAIPGGVKALGAGGSAGQKEQGAVLRRPLPGHLVGGVPGRGLGAVGVLLLLVDDDEADVFQRGKDGAPGPHHDVGTAVLYHLPLEQTLGVIEGRVLDGHPPPEPALEAEDHLRRQADLRHQHEGAAAQRQTPLDEL